MSGIDKKDSQQASKDFFDKYYSSNIMTLCVSSNQELQNIEKLVKANFGKFKNK